ncbi:MAG: hypothetical protein JWQ09_3658, partial [Segetibacter sp.]|nr:hypothetical protein [Segetibacter sp.]
MEENQNINPTAKGEHTLPKEQLSNSESDPFIIPASETQNLIPPIESDNNSTLSQQPATRNMEVHHHGHV